MTKKMGFKEMMKSKTVWGALLFALSAMLASAASALQGDISWISALQNIVPELSAALTAIGFRHAIK